MIVKELIALLKEENPNRLVVVQKDSEGNGYSPLRDVFTGSYVADSTWSGEVGLEKLTQDLKKQGYGPEDVKNGVPCLVIAPIC